MVHPATCHPVFSWCPSRLSNAHRTVVRPSGTTKQPACSPGQPTALGTNGSVPLRLPATPTRNTKPCSAGTLPPTASHLNERCLVRVSTQGQDPLTPGHSAVMTYLLHAVLYHPIRAATNQGLPLRRTGEPDRHPAVRGTPASVTSQRMPLFVRPRRHWRHRSGWRRGRHHRPPWVRVGEGRGGWCSCCPRSEERRSCRSGARSKLAGGWPLCVTGCTALDAAPACPPGSFQLLLLVTHGVAARSCHRAGGAAHAV